MSEIKGQILGVVLVLAIFSAIFAAITGIVTTLTTRANAQMTTITEDFESFAVRVVDTLERY